MYPCVAVQLDETTKCIKKDNFKQKQINVEMAGKKEDVENGKVNEAFEKNWNSCATNFPKNKPTR